MVTIKSSSEFCFEAKLIESLLCDLHKSHGAVFGKRALTLTLKKIRARTRSEGFAFLTKSLPRLAKLLDIALSQNIQLNPAPIGFKTYRSTNIPKFLGEFFSRIFDSSGMVLQEPCADSVRVIRQVCYLFYKYELRYTRRQENEVVQQFIRTEDELTARSQAFQVLERATELRCKDRRTRLEKGDYTAIAREARILLARVFSRWNHLEIVPRHGPGAVSTGERLWSKYRWTNVSSRLTSVWPLDAYFYASNGHICDELSDQAKPIGDQDHSARVCLVPKDSRGPRLISCEPVDFQWIQQGLLSSIVRLVERHMLTKHNVFFTDQGPNQRGALYGSSNGKYSTLDLAEASDRVSLDLVRLLFPSHVFHALESARSLSTTLPSGQVIKLQKFAPMGSAICFPTLALTIWSILSAGNPTRIRQRILVYGDDVIVPTAYAGEAIERLEAFGLKVNRSKSCTNGLFKESCGVDAFKGENVTPVKFKTVWSSRPAANVYSSWIAYANSMWDKQYHRTYDTIVRELHRTYGAIPADDMRLACPSLRHVSEENRPRRSRINKRLQKREWYVLDLKTPQIKHDNEGWSGLLRYFTEGRRGTFPLSIPEPKYEKRTFSLPVCHAGVYLHQDEVEPFSVSSYTQRDRTKVRYCWR